MPADSEQTGRILDGRYRVLARLGQGGMGTVYLAEHIGLGQRRAIKFLRQELARQPSAVKRFLQEARIVSSLRHEHVIGVLDMGQSGEDVYYVMELLEGEDLRALLRRERILPWSRVRAIALQICEALVVAHARGVTHRDLKPENCFCVRSDGGRDFIKLLDFGIAKVSRETGSAGLTAPGETLGTLGYMAPEQADGRADHRSDIYAMGVMMYEMLSGRMPHEGTAIELVVTLLRGTRARPLRDLDPLIAPSVDAVVMRALAPDPSERFADAEDLASALAALTIDPPAWARPAPTSLAQHGSVDALGPTLAAIPQEHEGARADTAMKTASSGPAPPEPAAPPLSAPLSGEPANVAPSPDRESLMSASAAVAAPARSTPGTIRRARWLLVAGSTALLLLVALARTCTTGESAPAAAAPDTTEVAPDPGVEPTREPRGEPEPPGEDRILPPDPGGATAPPPLSAGPVAPPPAAALTPPSTVPALSGSALAKKISQWTNKTCHEKIFADKVFTVSVTRREDGGPVEIAIKSKDELRDDPKLLKCVEDALRSFKLKSLAINEDYRNLRVILSG